MNSISSELIFFLCLLIGVMIGWTMRYLYDELLDRLYVEPHPFDHIFETNPHPEIFDNNGNLFRGDYISANLNEDPWEYELGSDSDFMDMK